MGFLSGDSDVFLVKECGSTLSVVVDYVQFSQAPKPGAYQLTFGVQVIGLRFFTERLGLAIRFLGRVGIKNLYIPMDNVAGFTLNGDFFDKFANVPPGIAGS
jgi:hypothetical protein